MFSMKTGRGREEGREAVKGEREARDLLNLVFSLHAYLAIFSLISAVSCQWWRTVACQTE